MEGRRPKDEEELRLWLESMIWHHHFSDEEIAGAFGMTLEEVMRTRNRFPITINNRPARPRNAALLVLPYPGGRHPRIQFLEGAVRPQRETKVSIFAPWDATSYAVADIPEAIFSNLGLTYLAHTHVPTLWTQKGIELERLEWERKEQGVLEMRRTLPNEISFGTRVVPGKEAVRMEMWLTNGTKERLTGLRVQNCVMLKGLTGFEQLTNENKLFRTPYAACRNSAGNRWVVTAWTPCQRTWANPPCPCVHSDPQFPDCESGQTQRLRGWFSFYEGTGIQAELDRIEALGWSRS